MKTKTVGIIGCGSLGTIVAKGIKEKLHNHYDLIGLCDGKVEAAEKLGNLLNCKVYPDVSDMLRHEKLDYIVEATGGNGLKSFAIEVLEHGCNLIVLSAGAFADKEFYQKAVDAARQSGAKIHIASGAIGGFDVIRSAMWQGAVKASIINEKPPQGLEGAPFLEGKTLSHSQNEEIFSGNAREAIKAFPNNVNVAVALALAATGVDNTGVKIISIPNLSLNTHTIELEGDFGKAKLEIASTPSDNAGSSALAAYSILAKLENLSSTIQF